MRWHKNSKIETDDHFSLDGQKRFRSQEEKFAFWNEALPVLHQKSELSFQLFGVPIALTRHGTVKRGQKKLVAS